MSSKPTLSSDQIDLDTYHPSPSKLVRQPMVSQTIDYQDESKQQQLQPSSRAKWLPRISSLSGSNNSKPIRSLRERLSHKMSRISSLDSTRSSSSIEADPYEIAQSKPETSNSSMPDQDLCLSRHRQTNIGSSDRTKRINDYHELFDDRQGMNSGEQENFTKGERQAKRLSSIDDGSFSGIELKTDNKKKQLRKKKKKNNNNLSQKQFNSFLANKKPYQLQPTSTSNSNSTSGTSGTQQKAKSIKLKLASRFKLTKKHESIKKFQLSVLDSGFVSLKTFEFRDLASFLPKKRLSAVEFEERVKLMRRYEGLAKIEYKFASRYETYVCRHASQESNSIKNNYKKCIPYDYNRVVLKTLPNVPDSDYINASHVDSYLKPNAYIAAQGPNEFTIEDFWRMIWEQKSFVIVMLTKVFDFIRVMCNQYWPVEVNKPERYGNLEVTLLYEEPLADFVIRTIKLTKLNNSGTTIAANLQQQEEQNNLEMDNKPNDTVQLESTGNWTDDYDDEEDEEEEDDDSSASASASELLDELMIDKPKEAEKPLDKNRLNLPTVRSPKYTSKSKRKRPAKLNLSNLDQNTNNNNNNNNNNYNNNDNPSYLNAGNQSKSDRQPFLHPLLDQHQLASSLSSLSSVPLTPVSPASPRTPTSLSGLDRSSATRKAVKKKRRARVKNVRPVRTQFQIPDESQLIDDGEDQANTDSNKSTERIIYQFHYMSWASHTCPFISSLLHFRRRVRICIDEMSKSGKTGPTIVHCNDGCGRTGTYLAIDANLELVEEDSVYDVFNYTKMMRQSRKFLIENLEQYKFVYDTIEEAMFCGRTWFPVLELHKRLKHKSQRNMLTKKNEYQREYEKITQMTSRFSIGDCAGGHRVENREKNRDVSTVPPDNFRPYLNSFQTNDSTDYINAVFVDGYTRSKEYIVTEWPLHRTISDFWSLIYDHECNSVILLANPPESSTYPSFLPSEKELRRKFGPVFSAEMVSYTHYQNIKSWIYTINKKIVSLTEVIAGVKSEAKTTQVFQITCWPQGHRVPTSTNALVELMNMVERWRQRTAYGPVCVVSLNGKSRAGVYCAANVAIEQVVQHSEVDVFQAVKTVRRHRPQLIENMTEYKYCYDLILHYVLHYVNQAPVNN